MDINTQEELKLFLDADHSFEEHGKGKKRLIVLTTIDKDVHKKIKLLAQERGIRVSIVDPAAAEKEKNNRWRKVATYCLAAFSFMLIGYFVFSNLPIHELTKNTYKWYQTLDKGFPIM